MLRKLALMMALSPAIWLSTAFALGLGEIDVKSALNQRFSASIPLNDLAPDEAETLQVGLAENGAFIRAGLERSDYLSTLSFTVESDDGAPRIIISSRQIAREPYFSLLMDVRSRSGHVLRQFTILLDPPDYALSKESQPVELTAPVAVEPQKSQKKIPSASAHSAADAAQAPAPSYGPVAVGETLWSIATRLRPRSDITMDQMQLALYKANPDAFENGHIGKLLKGVMLKVPSEKTITAVGPDAAKLRIQQLRAGHAPVPARTVAKEPKVTKAPPQAPKAEAEPVVPAAKATPAPEVSPVTKAPKAPAASATKPAHAAPVVPPPAPAVPAAKPVPAAAASAPASTVVAAEPASVVAASAPPSTATTALPLLEETASPVTAASPDAASEVVAESASSAQLQPVEPVKPYIPPPISPAPEPTPLMEEWKDPIMLFGGLAAAASLIGWFLISRRNKPTAAKSPKLAPTAAPRKSLNWQFWKKSATAGNAAPAKLKPGKQAPTPTPVAAPAQAAFDEEQFERDYEATQRSSSDKFPPETQRVEQPKTEMSQLPNFDSTQMFDAPLDAPLPAISTDTVDFDVTGKFEAETLKIDLNSNDPVAEADFHLAYGLYDEAALHLKQAAQKQPDRVDIPTKLAEVYFRAGKVVDFMEVAEGLKPRLPQAEWTKVALMGKQLSPDASLFQGVDTGVLADVDMAFDEPALAAAPVKSSPAAAKADAALEFDLTSLAVPKVEQPKPVVDAGNSLEFKLEDFDLETPVSAHAPKTESGPAATTKVDAPLEFDLSAFDLGGNEPAEHATQVSSGDDFKLEDFDLGMPNDSHAISTGDEASTKLDLARAYVDMGDNEMARSLLNEVLQQGSATQKTEAQTLLGRLA